MEILVFFARRDGHFYSNICRIRVQTRYLHLAAYPCLHGSYNLILIILKGNKIVNLILSIILINSNCRSRQAICLVSGLILPRVEVILGNIEADKLVVIDDEAIVRFSRLRITIDSRDHRIRDKRGRDVIRILIISSRRCQLRDGIGNWITSYIVIDFQAIEGCKAVRSCSHILAFGERGRISFLIGTNNSDYSISHRRLSAPILLDDLDIANILNIVYLKFNQVFSSGLVFNLKRAKEIDIAYLDKFRLFRAIAVYIRMLVRINSTDAILARRVRLMEVVRALFHLNSVIADNVHLFSGITRHIRNDVAICILIVYVEFGIGNLIMLSIPSISISERLFNLNSRIRLVRNYDLQNRLIFGNRCNVTEVYYSS